jgi:prepilin-type processing-associated H-X9-DG protein
MLRQMGLVWQMYSNEQRGYYPNHGYNLSYLYFISVDQRQYMVDYFKQRDGKVFYCPQAMYDNQEYWNVQYNAGLDTTTGKTILMTFLGYDIYMRQGYDPTGLHGSFTNDWNNTLNASNPSRGSPPPRAKYTDKLAAQTPLIFDQVFYGNLGNALGWGVTSHRENTGLPSGGNVCYGDGHVVWKPFKQMIKVCDYPTFQYWY